MSTTTATTAPVAGDGAAPARQAVQVRLHTRQKRFEVPDATIRVPTHLARYGLSEIVNHLLALPKPVPFDFIIDGKFLRSTLGKYLEQNELSTENTLEIEYVKSTLPPTPQATLPHDDWISSIAGPRSGNLIATGCYDGGVRLWTLASKCVAILSHEKPVKAVAWLEQGTSTASIFSGGDDNVASLWEFDAESGAKSLVYEAVGHDSAVESISVSNDLVHFATSSTDSTIRIWTTSRDDVEDDSQTTQEVASGKRKRLPNRVAPKKTALATLEGHVGPVSSATFGRASDTAATLYSGGWDHSVRTWDVESASVLHTMSCEQVVLSLDHSPVNGLLATGHPDSLVRLWDPRDPKGLAVKLRLASHKNMVSGVRWSSTSSYALASCSYDGTLKFWDMRSSTPLYTVRAVEPPATGGPLPPKLLAVDWDVEHGVVLAGGEEGKLRVFAVNE